MFKTAFVISVSVALVAGAPAGAETFTMENVGTTVGKHFTSDGTMLLEHCQSDRYCGNEKMEWIFGEVGFTVTGIADGLRFAKIRMDDGRTGYTAPSFWWSDAERASIKASVELDLADCAARKLVAIGMTAAEVRASRWDEPNHVNTTETADHQREQWLYDIGPRCLDAQSGKPAYL
jgi:hypothetical protein